MPAYTDPLAIPYPVAGDTLRDAVSTIPQQAAEKVDDLLSALSSVAPVNWTNLAHASGWAPGGSTTAYARRAGMVTLILGTSRDNWPASSTICTLPAGFRPARTMYFVAMRVGDGVPAAVIIQTSGNVQTVLAGGAGSAGLSGTITFAV